MLSRNASNLGKSFREMVFDKAKLFAPTVAGRYFLMDMQPRQPFFTFSCFQPLTVHAKNGANLI
jgi:hypothetical protein